MIVAGDMIHVGLCLYGWKEGLGWGEEVSEKGSVKQTNIRLNKDLQIGPSSD